jgi:hypothetical protein
MENLLIKNELIAISDRLGYLISEALRADTLFQLVVVEQQMQNLMKNPNM